jgi:hypothetical protein
VIKKASYNLTRQILFICILFFLGVSCSSDDRESISLKIAHYAGGAGLTLIYTVDENKLQVETNCDLENCKQKTVYTRSFDKNESDSFCKFIFSLQLDTLKSSYQTNGMLDGLFTKITLKKGFLSTQTSTFDNYSTPTTDTLFKYIDNLILTKKYRFHNWGQDE